MRTFTRYTFGAPQAKRARPSRERQVRNRLPNQEFSRENSTMGQLTASQVLTEGGYDR